MILFRTISQCQRPQSRTQKMSQYSYASFLLVNTFPKHTTFRHQRSVCRLTAIVKCVFWPLDPMRTTKGAMHARSRVAGARNSSYPVALIRPSQVKMQPLTRFPVPGPANIFQVVAIHRYRRQPFCVFTHLFHGACGIGNVLPSFDRR